MFKKILIANDGSEGAKHALKVAIDLAKKYNAELYSISVEEGVPHYAATIGEVEEFRKEANEFFKKVNDEAIEEARREGIELQSKVQAGHEVETIINYAKEGKFRSPGDRIYGPFKDFRKGVGLYLTEYHKAFSLHSGCRKIAWVRRWSSLNRLD